MTDVRRASNVHLSVTDDGAIVIAFLDSENAVFATAVVPSNEFMDCVEKALLDEIGVPVDFEPEYDDDDDFIPGEFFLDYKK